MSYDITDRSDEGLEHDLEIMENTVRQSKHDCHLIKLEQERRVVSRAVDHRARMMNGLTGDDVKAKCDAYEVALNLIVERDDVNEAIYGIAQWALNRWA